MPSCRTAVLALAAMLAATPGLAQTGGVPTGGLPMGGGANMTPEQARAMAERMMQQMGGAMGLDADALRNATPEQRREMLKGGAEAMAGQMQQQMEQIFGMPLDQVKGMSEEELRARMLARNRPPMPEADTFPLHYAPAAGFPDGSTPLPVTPERQATLAFDATDSEVLLVVADPARREILLRESRKAPFEDELDLGAIGRDAEALVVEVIDPATHRVIRRYRPVAAAE